MGRGFGLSKTNHYKVVPNESSGGNRPRHKTKKEMAVDRMQPSPELGALFGVHVPTPEELEQIRKEERRALQVEGMQRKEKYR